MSYEYSITFIAILMHFKRTVKLLAYITGIDHYYDKAVGTKQLGIWVMHD